jgi:CBS domain-containing protein
MIMPSVRSIMTRNPLTVTPETRIREAMELLCGEHLSGAPVVSGDRVAGVVSMTDLLSFVVTTNENANEVSDEAFSNTWENRVDEPDEEDIQELTDDEILDEWAEEESEVFVDEADPDARGLLDQHVVEEVMTTDIVSVPSSADIRTAAAPMDKHDIHRILVIDDGRLKGIVSSLDIARTVTARTPKTN